MKNKRYIVKNEYGSEFKGDIKYYIKFAELFKPFGGSVINFDYMKPFEDGTSFVLDKAQTTCLGVYFDRAVKHCNPNRNVPMYEEFRKFCFNSRLIIIPII